MSTAHAVASSPPVIAVIGAGRMGAAIVRTLASNGAHVRVWNRTHSRAQALTSDGVTPVTDLGDVAVGADAVISILTSGDAVADTLGTLGHRLHSDVCVVEASTIDPASMARVAAGLSAPVVSCALSGSPEVVAAGKASVFVSGDHAARSRADGVLRMFASEILTVGDRVEDAKLVKIGINAVLAGTSELLAESVVLLEASGVDRAVFAEALSGSVLSSTFTTYKLAALLRRDYTATFATRDLRKDVALALSQAAVSGIQLPFAERLYDLLEGAIEAGWGDADFLSLVPRLQAASGQVVDLVQPADRN